MDKIKISLSFVALLGVLAIPQKVDVLENRQKPEVKGVSISNEPLFRLNSAPELASAEEPPQLSARSAIAMDRSSGTILFSRNMDERLPIASVTKMMTALVVSEALDYGQTVTVERTELNVVGTNMGLVAGEKIKVGDLLKGMLIPSSNDAAKVLAATVAGNEPDFVRMMNDKARTIGLSSTNFSNPVGLDDPNNYSTCRDLVMLAEEFIKDFRLSEIAKTNNERVSSVDGKIKHDLRSSNKLLLENDKIIGIKTGYTSLAKGNLVTRFKDGDKELLTVVLNSDEREEDTRKLINWVLAAYRW